RNNRNKNALPAANLSMSTEELRHDVYPETSRKATARSAIIGGMKNASRASRVCARFLSLREIMLCGGVDEGRSGHPFFHHESEGFHGHFDSANRLGNKIIAAAGDGTRAGLMISFLSHENDGRFFVARNFPNAGAEFKSIGSRHGC